MQRTTVFSVVVLLSTGLLASARATADCPLDTTPDFTDACYHEYILYSWDTVELDVVILPPATPTALADLAAIEKSVDAWKAGIQDLGPQWLKDGLAVRRYTVGGAAALPEEAQQDPEIIIKSSEDATSTAVYGIGLQVQEPDVCEGQGTAWASAPHRHPGSDWVVRQARCDTGGYRCLVLNVNAHEGGVHRMYDLNSHEVGHCLGIGHVGDALDFTATSFPVKDIMSYQDDPDQVHCVSKLNIKALEAVYAPLLGQPGGLQPGAYVHMDPTAYGQTACQNP